MGNKIVAVVDTVGIVLVQMLVVGTVFVGMIVAVNSETGIVVAGIVSVNAIVAGMSEVDIDYNFLYVEQLGRYFRLCSIGIWIAGCCWS